jgi:hypothetical protein
LRNGLSAPGFQVPPQPPFHEELELELDDEFELEFDDELEEEFEDELELEFDELLDDEFELELDDEFPATTSMPSLYEAPNGLVTDGVGLPSTAPAGGSAADAAPAARPVMPIAAADVIAQRRVFRRCVMNHTPFSRAVGRPK